MTPAVSHIAWSPEEEPVAFEAILKKGVSSIEVAPGRIWLNPTCPDPPGLPMTFTRSGMKICGFQAILFSRPDLLLFSELTLHDLEDYLAGLAKSAASCGAHYLVFGAPKNRRVPEGMSSEKALKIAAGLFSRLASRIEALGVVFGIEANPSDYGCNFCTHVSEVIDLVARVNHPAIRWHLDTGELLMNSENVQGVIQDHARWIGSVHVSEPWLSDFSSPSPKHHEIAKALKSSKYSGTISLEMKRPEAGLAQVEAAVDFMLQCYFCR
jgi:sugar phosphate isomerase/epimerase